MTTKCKHCDVEMLVWEPPPQGSWAVPFLNICFNDDCPFFVRSPEWMKSHYNVAAMYRYRIDPETGATGAIPVWSPEALRDGIVPSEPVPVKEHDQ